MAELGGIPARYNKKSSAVKRIMQEARELVQDPSTDFAANPLEARPEGTEFEGGLYHGRILLPNNYPFAPPSLMFLTPNGRFELNKKVCLSITGYHPEYWQPAWGIRTVLVAVMGFLPTESKGAIGGLDISLEARKALALKSKSWRCQTCQQENVEHLPDVTPENAVKASLKADEMPEFSFGYEADKKNAEAGASNGASTKASTGASAGASAEAGKGAGASAGNGNANGNEAQDAHQPNLPSTTDSSTAVNESAQRSSSLKIKSEIDSSVANDGPEHSTKDLSKDANIPESTPKTLPDPALVSAESTSSSSKDASTLVKRSVQVVNTTTTTTTTTGIATTSTSTVPSAASPPSIVINGHASQGVPIRTQTQTQTTRGNSAGTNARQGAGAPVWLDALILSLGGILVAMIVRRFL
ncbi:hypothetical protein BGZ94_002071 [Podila epigama]|nr:hypothetical protein BGZ94_002071 [Podila epigama]